MRSNALRMPTILLTCLIIQTAWGTTPRRNVKHSTAHPVRKQAVPWLGAKPVRRPANLVFAEDQTLAPVAVPQADVKVQFGNIEVECRASNGMPVEGRTLQLMRVLPDSMKDIGVMVTDKDGKALFCNLAFDGEYQVLLKDAGEPQWELTEGSRFSINTGGCFPDTIQHSMTVSRIMADLSVATWPVGAQITVGAKDYGTTPRRISLPLKTDAPQEMVLVKESDGARFLKTVAVPKLDPYSMATVYDQHLRLVKVKQFTVHGGIRLGMDRQAVYEALGKPDDEAEAPLQDFSKAGLAVGFDNGKVASIVLASADAGSLAGLSVGDMLERAWDTLGMEYERLPDTTDPFPVYRYTSVEVDGLRATIEIRLRLGAVIRSITVHS
jgi:hypothetical protein